VKVGAAGKSLVTGHASLHRQLETRLAEFEGTEASLLFPSGFAANMGAMPRWLAPATWSTVIARTRPACSTAAGFRAPMSASIHTPTARGWASLLAESHTYRRRLIVTDGLFSMDGDLAPLVELAIWPGGTTPCAGR